MVHIEKVKYSKMFIYIYIYIYTCEGRSKASKLYRERRTIADYLSWQYYKFLKTKKTNSNFCLNFYAGEAHK